MSFGSIKLDKNDILFSKMIRERDDNKCIFCPKRAPDWRMTCSHFWGRGDKIHRFDPKNCDTLCIECHVKHEGNKQGYYRDFKVKQLGMKLYRKMEVDHYQKTKKYGASEKESLNKILKRQYASQEHLKSTWQVIW